MAYQLFMGCSWGNKGVHTFLKGIISPKVNIMEWLGFELTTMSLSNTLTTKTTGAPRTGWKKILICFE